MKKTTKQIIPDMSKKKWVRPKLIVITKGDRQERVLSACKGDGVSYGPGGNLMCDYESDFSACNVQSAS